jgi:hypothetical protein
VGDHGKGHGRGHQQGAKEAGRRHQQQHRAADLDHPRHIAEPLAEANGLEDLDHLRRAGELGGARRAESQRQKDAKTPDDAALGGG